MFAVSIRWTFSSFVAASCKCLWHYCVAGYNIGRGADRRFRRYKLGGNSTCGIRLPNMDTRQAPMET